MRTVRDDWRLEQLDCTSTHCRLASRSKEVQIQVPVGQLFFDDATCFLEPEFLVHEPTCSIEGPAFKTEQIYSIFSPACNSSVTGPSFTKATSIIAWNTPSLTRSDSYSFLTAPTKWSYNRFASSGLAAP